MVARILGPIEAVGVIAGLIAGLAEAHIIIGTLIIGDLIFVLAQAAVNLARAGVSFVAIVDTALLPIRIT